MLKITVTDIFVPGVTLSVKLMENIVLECYEDVDTKFNSFNVMPEINVN